MSSLPSRLFFAVLLVQGCKVGPVVKDLFDTDLGETTDGVNPGGPGGGGGGKDTDEDSGGDTSITQVDTDIGGGPGGDTDTGSNLPLFVPVSASMYVEFAVNGNGRLSDFRLLGTRYPSHLTVTMYDALGQTCDLEYSLDAAAFNTWVAGGTAPVVDLRNWVTGGGMYIAMALDAGLYTAVPTLCTFDPARWTADPHTAFLLGEWDIGAAAGMPANVLSILDQNGGISAFYGATFDPNKALGGNFRVPAGYFGTSPVRTLEAFGIAAESDAQMNVTLIQTGTGSAARFNFVPLVAADIYDSNTGTYAPTLIRLFSLFDILF